MSYGMGGWNKEIPGGDTISRAEAIGAICNSACGSKFCGLPCDDVAALKALPSAQPEQQWIPCSERLPNKADHTDDMVLVCYRNGSVRFNTYMNGWVQGNPVAWMPLPEPYREDDHEID